MKKIITLTLVFIMLLMQSVSAATMYSLDGRTLEVDDSEIEANRQVGWFYGKPVTMHALDGRTLTVGENDIEAYRQVGWFYGKPVTMYALDGRTLTIGENDVEMYKAVGWYTAKPVIMNSADGRTIVIGEDEMEAYKAVGWYYGKPVKMYALDGRTIMVGEKEIEAYRQVGWYYGKPVTIYALDGRTMKVGEYDVEAYRQVGWFYGKPTRMYAPDGRIITVGKNDVGMYQAVGWYTYPVCINRSSVTSVDSWPGRSAGDFIAPSSKSKETYEAGTGTYVQTWYYKNQGVVLEMSRDYQGGTQRVSRAIIEYSSPYKTYKGIKLGSSLSDIKKAYGSRINYSQSTSSWVLVDSMYDGIIFELSGGKVKKIRAGAFAE